MFGENMMSKKESSQEQENGPKNYGAKEKIGKMVKSFNFPEKAKKTIMAVLAGSILLQAGTAYAEAKSELPEQSQSGIEKALSGKMQEKIAEIKSILADGKNAFFEGVAGKAGVEPDQLIEKFSFSNNIEVVGDTPTHDEQNSSGELEKEGENIYFASYSGLGVISGGEFGSNAETVDSWDGYTEDFKTYAVNGVEVEPASAAMTFTAEGASENQAILEALEEAANMQVGEHVEVKRSLENNSVAAGDENSESGSNSEIFSEYIGNSRTAYIDSYKVTGIEKNSDGMYEASVEVVFGKASK